MVSSCSRGAPPNDGGAAPAPPVPAEDWFGDGAGASGLAFVHVNGMSGRFYMPEVLAPGVGFLDYDQDGDLDIYLVQGQPLGPGAPASRAGTPLTDRLYRNDLQVAADGSRRLRFTEA